MPAHLILDVGRALYVGPLSSVPLHQAAAAALLVGLDRSFELIIDKVTTTHDVTVVPARTEHALEFHGGRVAVLYFEVGESLPASLDAKALKRWVETALTRDDLETWNALLNAAQLSMPTQPLEPRIARIAAQLSQAPDEIVPAQALADAVELSVSRLEHLFTAQLGVPLRAYRGWFRMRLAAQHLLRGVSLTEAAHAAGFHDSSHFTHAFRDTFGLPPSFVFTDGLRGRVI